MEKITFTLDQPGTLLIGEAQKPINYTDVTISGNIDAVYQFFKKDTIYDKMSCYVEIDYTKRIIWAVSNLDTNMSKAEVTGKLIEDPNLSILQINKDRKFSLNEIKSVIKKSRRLFVDKDAYMVLLDNLTNFKAKVEKDIIDSNDQKGNITHQYLQKMKVEFALDFNVTSPVFLGTDPVTFKVDILADVREKSVDFSFESVELYEIEQDTVTETFSNIKSKLESIGFTKIIEK